MKKIFIFCILLSLLTSCSFANKKEKQITETNSWAVAKDFESENSTPTSTWEEKKETETSSSATEKTQNSSNKGETITKQEVNAEETTKKAEEEKIVKEFEKEIDGLFNLIEKDGE